MKKLSSWLIVMFILMFWLFRLIGTITASLDMDFPIKPIDETAEIVLLFVVIFCVPFIFKRKIIGALIYLAGYGWYFGRGLIENVIKIINGETLGMDVYTGMFLSLIGVVLPIVAVFDILFDKNRTNNPVDKKTDWFYKNEDYDRELDERADKNQYKTL